VTEFDRVHEFTAQNDSATVRQFIRLFHVVFDEAVAPTCPIGCLGLSPRAYNRLVRADGIDVEPRTVADVVELARNGSLMKIWGLGSRNIGEIHMRLIFSGFTIELPGKAEHSVE
jgi:hypothetical protein